MKFKFLYLDLIICAVWMLFVFGRYGGWAVPSAAIVIPSVFYRFVLAFSLSKKEIRTWLPLLIYVPLSLWIVFSGHDISVRQIGDYFFYLTRIEHNDFAHSVIKNFLLIWLFALPYFYYLFLLIGKKTLRTGLTWAELAGAILWHDKQAKTFSAILMVMLITFVTGLSMSATSCQLMCFTATPVTYWLICRDNKVVTQRLWVLVIAMVIFWFAQIMTDWWREFMLLVSLGMVAYVVTLLYQKTKNGLFCIGAVLYLGVFLPSFSCSLLKN